MNFRRRRTAATLPDTARSCPAPTALTPPAPAAPTLAATALSCVPPRKPVSLDWGSATRGARGDHNEDSYCTAAPVFVVADGMGGHAAGERASSAVVTSLATLGGRESVSDTEIGACITAARKWIGQLDAGDAKPPGSTLSGVIVTDDDGPQWTVVNIGDSRTYLLDSEALTQLTTDHTVAQELVDQGAISVAEARGHRYAHVLTRAILHGYPYPLDINQIPLHQGDRILVCSDGVSGVVDNESLADLLRQHADPRDAAVAIVAAVVEAGGTDDATAVVIDALDDN